MLGTIASTAASACLPDNATARAGAWLMAWDSHGIHRTATAGDQAGADWLIQEAASLGAVPVVETFSLDRLDPVDAYLEFDGMRISGVPVFDAAATGSDGVAGNLGPVGAEKSITVAELSPSGIYSPDHEELRGSAHLGLAIVCKGSHPGLGLLNAERFRHPYGAPAIHLPSEARDAMSSSPPIAAMSSATWVSTISWLGAPAGSGRPLMEVRSGCIMAPISVPSGVSSRSSRRATICVR